MRRVVSALCVCVWSHSFTLKRCNWYMCACLHDFFLSLVFCGIVSFSFFFFFSFSVGILYHDHDQWDGMGWVTGIYTYLGDGEVNCILLDWESWRFGRAGPGPGIRRVPAAVYISY